ncbi:MAG: (2Fe-2S)-binding protein [Chloroflexia bacterium]|nr:(2Fe-2S)-binding protein [Chloroflexia bacterium]MDQ3411984.1 (2Fe-2S)-binding protein [Chloroflexota bacterium]
MRVPVTVTVNGTAQRAEVEPRQLLVQFLRDDLGLTGAHIGCETSQCGACTVLLDGAVIKSCTTLTVQVDEQAITTIEGLAPRGTMHPVQHAFWEEHGLQCGYCTPGMVLSAVALLAEDPHPDEGEIRHAIEGNLCRCTGYHNIVRSIQAAAEKLAAGAAPTPVNGRSSPTT